jgi:hypothetical protein
MTQRIVRNLVLLAFMAVSFVSVHAWHDPADLCSRWSCGTCNYTWETNCSFGPAFIKGYQFSGCSESQERCSDNELSCMMWCTSSAFGNQVDDCKGPAQGCNVGMPAGSGCDELAGTMDCECIWFNQCST